ncbi:MAG: hypothetical protein Tsb008_14680 [Rhodothalassiaceae bacterium]
MTAQGRVFLPAIRLRLLPVFIGIAGMALVLRTGELAGDVTRLVSTSQAVAAQETHEDEHGPSDGEETRPAADHTASPAAQNPGIPFGGVSEAERSLLEDLRARRRQLEEREQQAALREQLLAATERRIDQKIADLKRIEENIGRLVAEHQAREDEQLKSIVKVYETMKPKDAAPIFEKLDISIQQAVAMRMKDSKMAALMAAMTPAAATELTSLLARGTELPHVEEALASAGTP